MRIYANKRRVACTGQVENENVVREKRKKLVFLSETKETQAGSLEKKASRDLPLKEYHTPKKRERPFLHVNYGGAEREKVGDVGRVRGSKKGKA